jgi:monothiol glutaredoxin
MSTEDNIRKQFEQNPIILYMKGTPDLPNCGFSAKAVEVLKSTGYGFAYVNVLEAPFIREKLPRVTQWPTFPQLIVNGDIVGGSDIVEELMNNGELVPILEAAAPKTADA